MQAVPLSKEIYKQALKHKISKIILEFSGGNDEGYLNIDFEVNEKGATHSKTLEKIYDSGFEQKVDDWAWSVYSYNGAGDGYDYGDSIIYDLENKTVSTSEWYTSRKETERDEVDLVVD